MKFVRYIEEEAVQIGILDVDEKNIISLGSLLPEHKVSSMQDVIATFTTDEMQTLKKASETAYQGKTVSMEQVKVLAPIERPVHDILCVGVNYSEHLKEAQEKLDGMDTPHQTIYFSKRAKRILGPDDVIEGQFELDDALDYEVELAIIIGKEGKNIPKDKVDDYIFGYSVFNDLSSRGLQSEHVQWFLGKSLDTYTAMGPVIVHKSDLNVPVEVISRLNGEERQHASTEQIITDIPTIIADLSKGMTLEPGDIIATGTPSGVGMGFNPPRYMKKGDVIECEIPGIGVLRNQVG